MPTLAPSQIEQIVEQIVTLLRQRERSVLAVRQDDLERGLDAAVWVRHAHLHIQQPTAAFMQQLACADSDWRAVQCVHEAWSLGVQVHISLHQQLLPLLHVKALCALPLGLSDHRGVAVMLQAGQLVGRSELAGLHDVWLLTAPHTLLTPLARDLLRQHHIHWIRQESPSCN